MKYLIIQDNRKRWPVHVHGLKPGEAANTAVERFQRNLAAMTPGGLNGATWTVEDCPDVVSALVAAAKNPCFD